MADVKTIIKPKVNIYWFKRDLRLHDHGPLEMWGKTTLENGTVGADSETPINIGLFVVEEEYWKTEKASEAQKQFVLECANELKSNLEKIGGNLLIINEKSATECFEKISQVSDIYQIVCHRETGNGWTFDRDRKVKKLSKELNIKFIELAQDSLVRASKTKITDFSERYYNFANSPQYITPQRLSSPGVKILKDITKLANLNIYDRFNLPEGLFQSGGESKAIENLISFLETRCLGKSVGYRKEMSSPLTGISACSRISPHLSWGSLSSRAAYQTATRALRAMGISDPRTKNIQSFITRLAWRSHFMQKFETLYWMEFKCLNRASENLHGWDQDAFEAWKNGMTGYPFVDACMRSLNQTKWLNFRARAMVVSFASYALNLDWRGFGPYLAQNFLDYEPGIHYSQLQMQGGTTLGSPPRIYSPLKQSIEKDPTGEFIRMWVPELKDVPDSLIHLPSDFPRNGYPPSVVDHTRLWSIMRSNAPKSPKITRRTITKNKQVSFPESSAQLELSLDLKSK
jgi:deoxyribodipyrimidine photo-lyase